MMDELDIGCTPNDEDCIPVTDRMDYAAGQRAECEAFKNMLERIFKPAEVDCRLQVYGSPHDFGTYYSVRCKFNDANEEAVSKAYEIEGNVPEKWDDDALAELRSNAAWVTATAEWARIKNEEER